MGSVSTQPAGEEGGHREPRPVGQGPETQEEVLRGHSWATACGSGRVRGPCTSEQDRSAGGVWALEVQGWRREAGNLAASITHTRP